MRDMNHTIVPLVLAGAFLLVFAAVPVAADDATISGVTPAVGYTSGKSVTLTITGVNFTTTEGDVWLEMSGEDDLDATITSWTDDTIICKIRISTAEEPGDWDLVVALDDDDETELVEDEAFTILDKITLSSITPESGQANDDDVDFTLSGAGLSDIENVYLYNEDYDNVTADDFTTVSSVKITGTFDLSDVDEDTYDVCVADSYGTIECDLSFEVTTDEVGSIDISSSPSGASIIVDGTTRGTTPDIVDDLVEGSHKVVLQKSGYHDWGKIVTVEADETTEVDADLVEITTVPTPVPTTVPTPVPTSLPATERTTSQSTITIPTTWAETSAEETAESPVEPELIIGAIGTGIGLFTLRRR
jgi:hypothetical protein